MSVVEVESAVLKQRRGRVGSDLDNIVFLVICVDGGFVCGKSENAYGLEFIELVRHRRQLRPASPPHVAALRVDQVFHHAEAQVRPKRRQQFAAIQITELLKTHYVYSR